jgi:hypothetical protein
MKPSRRRSRVAQVSIRCPNDEVREIQSQPFADGLQVERSPHENVD